MSARPTITRGWKGQTERSPDYFVEVAHVPAARPAPAPDAPTAAPDYAGKQIGLRLENWAKWCREKPGQGGGAACMTGAICEHLRKLNEGSTASHSWRNPVDANDAVRVEVAMRVITDKQRMLLEWCYVAQAEPGYVMRKMSFPDATAFLIEFYAAQEAVQAAISK